MTWTTEQHHMFHGTVATEQQAYHAALEKRCKHLEEIINVTDSLLGVIVTDFGRPSLKPILGSVVERVNSIAIFVEMASAKNTSDNEKHGQAKLPSS